MKRKGFTLVELLAVIVILAIIALITTVVVINIVETVKIRKYKVEEKSLEKAAELYYTNSQIFPFQDEISLNTLVEKGFINSVKDTGNGSTCEGKVIKDNNGELKGCLKCSNYVTEGCGYVIEQEIKDENPGVICGNGTEEDYDKQEECHIKSVEDLVAFSYLVNSGKTFEGKTVYLDKDLDITNYAKEKSYVDPDKEALYDINGDGETTSLKDEMTTDKGFQPIGTNEKEKKEKKFKGKFEGKAYTISNLMINRPDEDYVGLFGYVTGDSDNYATIVGLNIENINVKGKNYVGGVVGYAHSYADINEVMVSGNVLGEANNIGGIVGYIYNENYSVNVTSVISNTNVTGNAKTSNYIGGIAGYVNNFNSSTKITGIIESGTISGSRFIYAISSTSALTGTMKTAHVNKDVKVTGDAYVYDYDESKGEKYSNSEYGNINLYNDYIDTWLGGDNDGSGYYFDYESETSNKIVLRSNSINTKFEKGSGTKENPYLIYNAEDMKKIAAMPTEQNYYKLMNDIDYNNKHYYMIGTSKNQFSGAFEGGAHTLKNIKIFGKNAIGLIGTSKNSLIQGLNVENIYVTGNTRLGAVTGQSFSGIISEINVTGTIESIQKNDSDQTFVGGIVGTTESPDSIIKNSVSNMNVIGKKFVGGIVGYNAGGQVSGIVEGGTITGTSYVYGSGYSVTSRLSSVYINEKVVIKSTGSSSEIVGTIYEDSEYGNINLYNDYIDTWLGGDNDGSGYYFDYESETSNKILLRSTEKYPINTKFEKGSGTKEDPYLIYNENDMKKIAAMPTEQNYYKLMSDIDYSNKHYYMIGTSTNVFSGMFDGGAHTLKNINIYGYNYIGLFGNIKGSSTQYSTITGLNVKNIKVKGNNYVGGLSGYINYAKINEVTLTGTIIGNEKTGMYIGGIVGSVTTINVRINSVIVNANVTGNSNVGGISGGPFSNSANVTAIIEGGTITGNDKVYATSYWNTSSNMVKTAYVNSKVKVIKNSKEVTGYYGGTLYNDDETGNINLYNDYIDTWLGGDNDGSGYYFDYESETSNKIVLRSTEKYPINTIFEKGSGTKEDPYLIYNENDMKKIAAMPTEQNYYKLMSDIDYSNKHYYMIGTSTNVFSGMFDGGAHTLKNINIYGYNYIGLFGNIKGSSTQYSTITGLNVKNIKVKGNNYVGGLSGYINYAKINEVTLTGTIIGNEKTGMYIGGIVGSVTTINVRINSVIVNANVTGNSNVGGISGGPFSNSANVTAIIEGGTITGNDKVYATSYWNTSSNMVKTAYVNSKVKVIKNSEEVTGYYGGTEFSESYYNNLQYYGNLKLSSKVVIETPYSGDIDASGYYFDYNNDGTDIIVVKANNSSQSSTTGNVVYTKTVTEGDDKEAPKCTLGRYSVHGNGFTASYTCTDNIKVKARKHIYWVAEPNKVNYEDLISWPSTTDSSSETVSSVWTVESVNSIGIEPPSKGSCYYFYYGAQDEARNTVIYATPNCISY